jgi:hypothetical protein
MMSGYLYDIFLHLCLLYDVCLPVCCLPACTICLPVWCLPTCIMSSYLYDICLPVWHLPNGIVSDTASRTSEDECKWQLAPNDLFSWNNDTMNHNSHYRYVTLWLPDARWHLVCAWFFLEAVMEPSSLSIFILLCLLSSPVRTQLMLIIPLWGPGALYPQNGDPSPRIRAYSLPRVQNRYDVCLPVLCLSTL